VSDLSILDRRDRATTPTPDLLVHGARRPGPGAPIAHHHPTTGEVVFEFPTADPSTVAEAIDAARTAFDDGSWPTMPGKERAGILRRIASLIRADADNLNTLLSLDNATPSAFTGYYQMGAEYSADLFDHYAGWIDKVTGRTFPTWEGSQPMMLSLTEPIGVVGVITPWNAPVSLFSQKVAPALAAGCTIVAKPSELAPLTGFRMAELLADADLPPGVFNLVAGGPEVGEALVADRRVDKVSFTGSRAVGARIAATVGERIGRVSLELGGKNPGIVFADARDLGTAVGFAAGNAFMGMSGQVCVCQSKLLVERSVYDEVLEHLVGFTAMSIYGDPFDPGTTAAPMISRAHLDRVNGFVERAVDAGATLAAGGGRPEGAPAGGYFAAPTVLTDLDPGSEVVREEIFGPVVCAIPFDDEDDAVRLANDTAYGLAAAVYTSDSARTIRLMKRLKAGNVGFNTWTLQAHVPFGGVRQSGLDHENGEEGIRQYLDAKTVFLG
jgi:aldehyde dehydrogenase (NAD+)